MRANPGLASLIIAVLVLVVSGCSTAPKSSAAPTQPTPYLFDSAHAFSYLQAQCAMGDRDPRLPAHAECEKYIISALKHSCDIVTTQNFPYSDPDRHVHLELSNIFGVINPNGRPRIMLDAHWDTRPTADNDFDASNRSKPIPGADDGASGVAVLIALADALHREKPKCCVILGFWDGEDWGPGEDKMYLGARYFGDHPGVLKPDESILIDMIGQKDLLIPKEGYSVETFPNTVNSVWQSAAKAGQSGVFQDTVGEEIGDDQQPIANELKIPSIDLIDFNYAYWHTLQDTPDKCDQKSLHSVGVTLEQYVRDVSSSGKI